jgi:hypothetical protein
LAAALEAHVQPLVVILVHLAVGVAVAELVNPAVLVQLAKEMQVVWDNGLATAETPQTETTVTAVVEVVEEVPEHRDLIEMDFQRVQDLLVVQALDCQAVLADPLLLMLLAATVVLADPVILEPTELMV